MEYSAANLPLLLIAGVVASLLLIGCLFLLLVRANARRKRMQSSSPLIEGVADGFVVIDKQRRVTGFNRKMSNLLPLGKDAETHPQAGMEVRSLYEQLCEDSTQALQKLDDWLGSLSNDSTSHLELTTKHEKHWLISERNIQEGQIASTVRDISKQRQSLKQLDHVTGTDALTGLPNRSSLMDSLRQAARERQPHALLVCDLRDFRQINDSYGQYFADQLLIEVATRLQQAMPENATVARIAGDEFGVLVKPCQTSEELCHRATDFLDSIARGVAVAARKLPIRASMGLSMAPQNGSTASELVSAADSAVARAKVDGSNVVVIYDRHWQQAADRAHQIDIGLEKALERDEFTLQYQPQIDVRTGLTCGMEALLRWHSRSLGMVPPIDFIPRAERSDLISRIGQWVVHQAVNDYQRLAQIGTSPATLSINLSRRQFANEQGILQLLETIRTCGISPELLTLEITETALLEDREKARDMLFRIKNLGVNLSVDDFGVGYSSFAELRDFPIDEVKIDKTFVHNLATCTKNQQIIRSTVAVAESLGAEVVVEGIETQAQFEQARLLGCHRAQGFFLCEPMQATMIPDVCLGKIEAETDLEATLILDS